MVICIIALVVFSVASIWSVKYRRLAAEALKCVANTLVLKPCTTKLDERIKSKLTAKLMKMPALARFTYKNFKLLSWIFTIIFFGSMSYSVYGIYNLAVYGSCEPGSVCVVNQGVSQIIKVLTCYEAQIVYGIIIFVVITMLSIKYLKVKVR